MKIRYYGDADIREWYDHTLRLLRTLHDEHGITVEIDRIDEQHGPITDFPGDVRHPSPEEVYERDLKRNRDLNRTIDPTPSEAFKRYGTTLLNPQRKPENSHMLLVIERLR